MFDATRKVGAFFVWMLILLKLSGVTLLGLITLPALGVALVQGNLNGTVLALFVLGGLVGLGLFVRWLAHDAATEAMILHRHHPEEPNPDGDMSDVAGIPRREPWLG